ncbi:MAG TPA: hypothetical protein VK892_07000, partial [Pyrinomonadaceae bacterium]|nr:hypothetical protein [Pyrinomonadaceae bacterium]
MDGIKITEAALNVYCFAPKDFFKDEKRGEETRGFFTDVWKKCESFGIKDEIASLDTEFPPDFTSQLFYHPLAAKYNKSLKSQKNLSQQVLIFEHGDYVGLIITIEENLNLTDLTE